MRLPFSPSGYLQQKHPSIEAFRYWEGMDWDRVITHYAIIDPMDPRSVLYLTVQDYNRLSRVALTMDTSLKVIARPGDDPPHDFEQNKTKTLNKISPFSRVDFLHARYWKSTLSKHIALKDTMVVISADQIVEIVRRYSLIVASYSGVRLSPNFKNAVLSFSVNSRQFIRSQGINNYILRLKVTKFCLEAYLAGMPVDTQALGMKLKLSKGGLPCWLPLLARQSFYNRSIPQIRFWLSIVNMYRAIQGVYTDPDFSSIVAPAPDINPEILQDFENFLKLFCKKHYIKGNVKELIPDHFPVLTSASGVNPGQSILSAAPAARVWGLQRTNHLFNWMKFVGDKRGLKMYNLIRLISRPWADWYRSNYNRKKDLFLGRLHLKYEAAGKIRVFAMVDYFTQYCMLPLHKKLFKLLEIFQECDATFDQNGAVSSFMGKSEYYSYDLKSATDLIPIHLYKIMLNVIFKDERVGDLWSKLLVDREFGLPIKDPKNHEVYTFENKHYIRYGCGQPMGALSSWASLALLHNLLIQYASYKIKGSPERFTDYRVLGDDVVIADGQVAAQYLLICEKFGIPISLAKSLISPPVSGEGKKTHRLFQFANQIALGPENISPLSLKEEIQANTLTARLELISKLVSRDWHRIQGIKPLSFYLRALNPTRWALGLPQLTKGKTPLFVEALLPVLLSPMSKDVGLTGLSKFYAWYQVLTGSYNLANLLKHKFWQSEIGLEKHKAFVNFLSDRAQEIYREILTRQRWGGIEKKADQLLVRLADYPRYSSWWVPYCTWYLDRSSMVPEKYRDESIDLDVINQDWLRPLGSSLNPEGGEHQAWQVYKESALPLLSVAHIVKGKEKKKKIQLDFTNLPLVAEALKDYYAIIKRTISPLLQAAPPNAVSMDFGNVSNTLSFIAGHYGSHPGMDSPGVFCLRTQEEISVGQSLDWDWEEPLYETKGDPETLEITLLRLIDLLSIQKLYDNMNPTDMLKRILLAPQAFTGYSTFLSKLILRCDSIGLRRHLLLIKRKILPASGM
jgi:hypothetical protein